jgi:hypothetical protein
MSEEQIIRNAREVFERERDRLFKAARISDDDWRETALKRPREMGEKPIPGTHTMIQNQWRDCASRYLVNVNGKQVYMELRVTGVLGPTGAAATPRKVEVVVAPASGATWNADTDYATFAYTVRDALDAAASRL